MTQKAWGEHTQEEIAALTEPIRSTDDSLNGTIATYGGGTFQPLTPNPDDVRLVDIAHPLAQQCRFTGHTRRFYSVAQHSVHCAEMVQDWLLNDSQYEDLPYPNAQLVLTALMHDASEAYLADISRPIKMVPEFGDVYKKFEGVLEIAIAVRFNLVYPYPEIIKRADNALLRTEQRDLMPPNFLHAGDDFYPATLQPWSPVLAEDTFIDMFESLQRELAA